MTDEDKALVDRLFAMADEYDSGHHESWPTIDALEIAAHRIEAQAAKIEKLCEALTQIARLRTDLRGDFSLGSKQSDIARAALGEMK